MIAAEAPASAAAIAPKFTITKDPAFQSTQAYRTIVANLNARLAEAKSEQNISTQYSLAVPLAGAAIATFGSLAAYFLDASPGVPGWLALCAVTEGLMGIFRRAVTPGMTKELIRQAENLAGEATRELQTGYAAWRREVYAREIVEATPIVQAIDARVREGRLINYEHLRDIMNAPPEALEGACDALKITVLQMRRVLENIKDGRQDDVLTYASLNLDRDNKIHEPLLLSALEKTERELGVGDFLAIKKIPPVTLDKETYIIDAGSEQGFAQAMDHGFAYHEKAQGLGFNLPDISEEITELPNLEEAVDYYHAAHRPLDMPALVHG